ncbi:MAG: sugar phosphate isomerase/epimerase [Eubacteriales bacterium]|nr:sugar phosphate isomerase/epimerase [Eubacteriales bacterium]
MRFGFCTEFASAFKDKADYELLERISKASFDFVEFRLKLLAELTEEEFALLSARLRNIGLAADVSCALFPGSIRLTGPDADNRKTRDYLKHAFARAAALGSSKLVFGSAPARELPDGVTWDEGYRQLTHMIKEVMLPLCGQYDINVVIEPIRSNACNFIHTLKDGMKLVEMVDSPRIGLLADSLHMLTNKDDPEDVTRYLNYITHVHISNSSRALPEDEYEPEVLAVLENLKSGKYDNTISFESNAGTVEDSMTKALGKLRGWFCDRA